MVLRTTGGLLLVLAVALAILYGPWSEAPPPNKAAETVAIALRPGLDPGDRMTARVEQADLRAAMLMYRELTGREAWPDGRPVVERLDGYIGGRIARTGLYTPTPKPDSGISIHRDGLWRADEIKQQVEGVFAKSGLQPVPRGSGHFELKQVTSRWTP